MKIEYSIDEFVTEGNGTLINTKRTSQLDTAFNIDVSTLEPGIHKLYFRSQNEDGAWSLPSSQTFYIPEREKAENVIELEYSIDKYLREGQGHSVLINANSSIDTAFSLDVSGLKPGIHTLYTRAKNDFGRWSLPTKQTFYISKKEDVKIISFNYKVYNDAMDGDWQTVELNPAQSHLDTTLQLDVKDLEEGTDYSIELYAQNSKGLKGYSAQTTFTKITNVSPMAENEAYNIELFVEDTAWLSMDTMFIDENTHQGDSLVYALANLSDDILSSFVTWDNDSLIKIIPTSSEANPYSFWIKATDLAGESDSLKIVLNVTIPNHAPIALKKSLAVSVEALQKLGISMDTLFNDEDISNGDQLQYALQDMENTGIADFSTWTTAGVLEINPTTEQIGTHNFWIVATDQYAEKDSTEVNLTVTDVTSGIPTVDSENVTIYPNPTTGQLFIKITGATTKENTIISIHNMVGKVVFESHYKRQIDLSGLENGIYILKVSYQGVESITKIILQR
jgi:hypothetical protein